MDCSVLKINGTSLLHEGESPSADPHARWRGRGPGQPGPYPDRLVMRRLTETPRLHENDNATEVSCPKRSNQEA